MNSVQFNFINLSNDAHNSDVVIFQQMDSPEFNESVVAWQVIQNCGKGDNHPFDYSFELSVAASDSWGNFTPQFPAQPGQAFAMVHHPSGDQLVQDGNRDNSSVIVIHNKLPTGSINAWIYRGGKKLATYTNVVPGRMVPFAFAPNIFIGVVSGVEEGAIMDSAVLSKINTQLSLLGIQSADIVMTDGGKGPDAKPFQFTLENVVMTK